MRTGYREHLAFIAFEEVVRNSISCDLVWDNIQAKVHGGARYWARPQIEGCAVIIRMWLVDSLSQ